MEEFFNNYQWPPGLSLLGWVGLLIVVAMVFGRLANFLRCPRVTGYLLAGIVLGPSGANLLSWDLVTQKLSLITDIALAIIAFSVGGAISIPELKKTGKALAFITFSQAFFALFFVAVICLAYLSAIHGYDGTYFRTQDLPSALVLGAIAMATAPGAILAIVHEYRAKGFFTRTLLGVIAIDDALALVVYGLVMTFLEASQAGENIHWFSGLMTSFFIIIISLIMGSLLGLVRKLLHRWFPDPESLFGIIAGFLFLTTALTHSLGGSPLLAAMTLGLVVGNYVEGHETVFNTFEEVEAPIFALFFSLAGAYLDFSILQIAGGLIILYSLVRFGGKIFGTWLAARLTQSPPTVRKYLGLALLPQAGVSIGLILNAEAFFGGNALGKLLVSVIIGSTILNELLTPLLVHYALVKAGEAQAQKTFHLKHL